MSDALTPRDREFLQTPRLGFLTVDPDGGRVLGEAGGPPGADLAVLDWGRRVAAVAHERRQALDDLVLTTERAFHVVRLVLVDTAAPEDGSAWGGAGMRDCSLAEVSEEDVRQSDTARRRGGTGPRCVDGRAHVGPACSRG